MVPMTAEDFQRRRNRKIAIWAGGIAAGVLFLALVLWTSSAPTSARNDLDDAKKLYNAGKFREAVSACDRAISAKSNLTEAYQLRGTLYTVLNEPQNAIKDLSHVIEMHPDQLDNYRLRAECYRQLGDVQSAVTDYNKIIQTKPTSAAYVGRGTCFRDLQQQQKALQDFDQAVQLEPNVDNLLQRGMAYTALGDHRKAIADYDRVVELRPDVPFTYHARAYARDAVGDPQGAAADRDKARLIEHPVVRPEAVKRKSSGS